MDPVLAQIYGTNNEASDLEKLASAQMEEDLSNDGMDLDGAGDDDIEAMAQAVLNDIQGEEQGEPENDVDDETMAKVAEADKLGRVMAHSMWQELGQIKEAGKAGVARKAAGRVATALGRAAGYASHPLKAAEIGARKVRRAAGEAVKKGEKVIKKNPKKSVGAALAGGVALGVGGEAARRHMSKDASALDTLAEARALEILEANGIDPSTLAPMQEKVAAGDPAARLSSAVEQGAWDILAQYGLEPSEG